MAGRSVEVERSDELVQITKRFLDAIVHGDLDQVAETLSEDPAVILLGTDEEEFWVGRDATLAVMRAQIEESPGESFLAAMEYLFIEGWAQGTLGWVVCDAVTTSSTGRSFRSRFTVIYHLEGIRWRLIHAHTSAGQRNEELWGLRVTTRPEAIAAAVGAERPDLSSEAAGDGTVTIVFTDIEASTEIAERLGDAQWLSLLRWHDAVVADEAARRRGRVVKSEGDGYMLAFPTATGALDFASALQVRTADGFGEESVRVRVGVNAGDVIAEREDFFGHAVTVAARVVAKARGGETVVTDPVAALVAGSPRFRFSEPRGVELKGLIGEYRLRTLVDAG